MPLLMANNCYYNTPCAIPADDNVCCLYATSVYFASWIRQGADLILLPMFDIIQVPKQ